MKKTNECTKMCIHSYWCLQTVTELTVYIVFYTDIVKVASVIVLVTALNLLNFPQVVKTIESLN